jgi:hypothetical protein
MALHGDHTCREKSDSDCREFKIKNGQFLEPGREDTMRDSYPAISPFEKHTYGWAMDQLAAGNEVRRQHWPIEVVGSWDTGKNHVWMWHLYPLNDNGGMCQGFNSGVVGADNDYYDGLGVDSMGYGPTREDLDATDWQTTDEVTQEQISYLDAHRTAHWPSYEKETPPLLPADHPVTWIIVSIVVMIIMVMLFRRW